MDFRLPSINGQTSQEQIGQMKSYIYQLVEQLNFAFSSLENSNYEIVDTIVKVNGNEEKSADRQSKFNQLKDLIIKTAAIVNAYEEVWIKEFKGSYTADSDFGKYSRQTLNQITANSTNITAAFTKLSEITNPDNTGMLDIIQAYIKAGLLDESAGEYGLEIGQADNGSFTHFARFTASKLSFYSGNNNEVAYISNNKLFINEAQFNDVVSIGNASGGELNIYNGKINVYVGTGNNQRRVLYADNGGNLVLSGIIHANEGDIGGWNIINPVIYNDFTYSTFGNVGVGMCAVPGTYYAFWAGAAAANNTTAPFRVGHDGSLYATKGYIGGWKIDSDYLYGEYNGNACRITVNPSYGYWIAASRSGENFNRFYVDTNGTLHATGADISGIITADDGHIGGWIINRKSLQHVVGNVGNIVLNAGASRADDNVMFVTQSTEANANFKLTLGGHLTCTGANITGTIRAGSIISSNNAGSANPTKLGGLYLLGNPANNGGIICSRNQSPGVITGYSHSGLSFTEDLVSIVAVGSNGKYASVHMDGNSGTGRLSGTWSYTNGSSGSLSDKSHKNSIELLDGIDRFNILFDKLKPIRYKYNAGTSNRYHIGYIAQEVESAISQSQLTEKDAALVIDIPDHDEDGNILESSTKYLRYEEFIALNTWQIQKAKARIAELENTVTELTTRMTELESRLSAIESILN